MTAGLREGLLARLASESFDVLVIGGGATGAGIARDAALRGLTVALIDAGDFAGQTSSHSSKLIHGGLRYLQYGDLPLVFEGLRERRHLMSTAPHLCHPIEFVFPAYHGESPGLAALGAGVALYNALALWRPPATGRRLQAHQVYGLAPRLRTAGLAGAQAYVDCQTDDARLVLANVLDAAGAGAACANHVTAAGLLRDRQGRALGAMVADAETGARFEIRARLVVSAAGPFTDGFLGGPRRLRPTLGVHLVLDAARLPHGGRALVLRTPQDNRLYFVLPAGTRTIVGTTDTDFAPAEARDRPPRVGDEIRAQGRDVGYLLEALNHAFPSLNLGPPDVLSTFAGLRPLLSGRGQTPSETSREHTITACPDRTVVVAGGKLTTLRRMGEETVDRLVEMLRNAGLERPLAPCTTTHRPLPGADRRDQVLSLATPALAAPIDPALPYLWAEIVYAARAERARRLTDALIRRVPIFRDAADQGLSAAPRAADLMAGELGWSAERRERELSLYREAVAVSRRWSDEPLRGPS
ncbi:MAG TPA: glycerol-3-phosphate dehydrogenase/oxidase [Polyangia bacterium]|nr:glycerol-3-phosphate dehydrogenase/oxidase [Polyangia bacterium]